MTFPGRLDALRTAALAATIAMPAAVFAQDAPAPAPTEETGSPWIKICQENPETKQQACNISQVLLAQNGSVIASFSLQPEGDKVSVGAFVPLGFVIPAGVNLMVDGQSQATAQFTICVPPSSEGPAGCAARADLTSAFVDALKRGNKLGIVLANTQGQQIPIELSLVGFSKTYDGEGLDPVAARAAEVEQSKQLQEDARAAFQRMIERQQAEQGTAN